MHRFEYDKALWTVTQSENGYVLDFQGYADLIHANANNAQSIITCLDHAKVSSVVQWLPDGSLCICPKGLCPSKFTFQDVCRARIQAYSAPNLREAEAHRLRGYNVPNHVDKQPRTKYYIGPTKVCRKFYQRALGLDHRVVNEITNLVHGKLKQAATPPKKAGYRKKPTKYNVSYAFWADFFSVCQRPNDEVRLFPVNQSFYYIYCNIFWPWWLQTYRQQMSESEDCTMLFFKEKRTLFMGMYITYDP